MALVNNLWNTYIILIKLIYWTTYKKIYKIFINNNIFFIYHFSAHYWITTEHIQKNRYHYNYSLLEFIVKILLNYYCLTLWYCFLFFLTLILLVSFILGAYLFIDFFIISFRCKLLFVECLTMHITINKKIEMYQ